MKSKHRPARCGNDRRCLWLAIALLAAGRSLKLWANPQGMTVVAGSASAQTSGSQLNVNVGQFTILNWNSFNIQAGETTTFNQPSVHSIVFNGIGGANPSQIWGRLNANGTVILANAHGFYFGPNSMISVGGNFIATTAPLPPDFGAGAGWQFTGMPPLASIVNYGQIEAGKDHSLFLIAEQIENHGALNAPGGNIGLCAGKEVLISERPDGRGLSAGVQMPSGSVDNTGRILADAGTIALQAQVVNQDGLIQANSVRDHNGAIELIAGDAVNLGPDSVLSARGEDSSVSGGGTITIKSGGTYSDAPGSSISVAGSALGGDGGTVEISAPDITAIHSSVDGHAAAGSVGGKLVLDPTDIVLGTGGSDTVPSGASGSGQLASSDSPDATLYLDVGTAANNYSDSAFIGFSQIDLQATHTITLSDNTTWDLANSTGKSGSGCQLTLEAGTDAGSGIIIGNNASILGGAGWSVTLEAGRDFSTPGTVVSGVGNITFNGGGGVQTQDGSITLLAGNSLTLNSGDFVRTLNGGGVTATVLSGSLNNGGQFVADGGSILLQATTLNQNGTIQANSVGAQSGSIDLEASAQLSLGAGSQILASGDNSPSGSAGGSVILHSGNNFSDSAGSQIVVTGGAQAGDGGSVEISAPNILSLNSIATGGSQAGWSGGQFLLGAANLAVGASGSTAAWSGSSSALTLNEAKAFNNNNASSIIRNFSGITLEAIGATGSGGSFVPGNITLNANTAWNLSSSTGNTPSGQLTLEAAGNIAFASGSRITDPNNWSLILEAGYDFANNSIQSGVGSITLNGGSARSPSNPIQLSAGSLGLFAGQSIVVGFGSVFTTGGGSIFADALAGDINAGTGNGGYVYNADGSFSVPNPGGIATAAGGDVTLIAGGNVISVPTVPASIPLNQSVGASGAYGSGDVTVIAGNQISGNYTLANGVGTLLAGVTVQSAQITLLDTPNADPAARAAVLQSLESAVTQSQNPNGNIGASGQSLVNLSLIDGSWNAWAANNIYIGEVRNPNGTFNGNSLSVSAGEFGGNTGNSTVPATSTFLFNYAPDAAVNFWAGNGITLDGSSLQRVSGYNDGMPPVYAPILSLNAGAGGITLDSSIILYPSGQGALQIATHDGGNLVGAVQSDSSKLAGITMSDSGLPGWSTFQNGDALLPLHLNDPNPVTLDISGSIGSFGLDVPTYAQITVEATQPYTIGAQNIYGTYNFGFSGRNLSPAQTTSINVAGDITYRGDLTTETLNAPLPSSLFTLSTDPAVTDRLRYDSTTQSLIFIGVMSQSDLAFLLNPTVFVVDQNGNPKTVSLTLTTAQTAAINELYTDSQTAKISDESLALAGPGSFNITAQSMDLGVSGGIAVVAPPSIATSLTLADALPAALLDPALSGDPGVAGELRYDAATGTLTSIGVMSKADLNFLLNPTEIVTGANGKPVIQPVTLDATQLAAIRQLYSDSLNAALGANLNVTVTGNLDMTSTKIANENLLGNIQLTVGGTLNAGGQFTPFDDPNVAKGIFTTSGGNVLVTADGDVDVNSSRIAAYNGGNVSVSSTHGDVNAGSGESGFVSVNAVELNPRTGELADITQSIPGSGILATTLPGSFAPTLGNITMTAPEGSINASLGGITQIAFNDANSGNAFINLTAGHDINAGGSGIIGSNIRLQAGGSINGLVVGTGNVAINSQENVNVTAFGGGDVSINAAGSVSGTVIGGGSVDVSGTSITAALLGSQVSASGDTSGSSGIPQFNVAKEDTKVADDASTTTTQASDDSTSDDEKRKKGKGIVLAQKTGRVTVILPTRNP
jgi:filamentous hemagglutinin family protein